MERGTMRQVTWNKSGNLTLLVDYLVSIYIYCFIRHFGINIRKRTKRFCREIGLKKSVNLRDHRDVTWIPGWKMRSSLNKRFREPLDHEIGSLEVVTAQHCTLYSTQVTIVNFFFFGFTPRHLFIWDQSTKHTHTEPCQASTHIKCMYIICSVLLPMEVLTRGFGSVYSQ
jgi:hypothetical protein